MRRMAQFLLAFAALGIWTPALATVFTVIWRLLQTWAWFRADSFEDRPFFDENHPPMYLVYWIWLSTRAGLVIVVAIALIVTFFPMRERWKQWAAVVTGNALSLPVGGAIVGSASSMVAGRVQLVSFIFLVVSSVCFYAALRLLFRADRRWWHLWDVQESGKQKR